MNTKKRIARYSLIGVVTCLVVLGSLIRSANLVLAATDVPTETANGSLSLSASTQTIQVGDSFDVKAIMTIDQPTCSAQAILTFDPKLVEVDGVEQGDFYKTWAQANGMMTVMLPSTPKADNNQGTVPVIGVALLGGKCGPTGTGTFLTFHVKAKANGVAQFSLSNIIIDDNGLYTNGKGEKQARPYQGIQSQGLAVSIGQSGGSVVQPTAQAALVPTVMGSVPPTQEATAVKRVDTLTSGNSGFPLWIFIPVAGVLVIAGVVVFTSHKGK